MLMQIKVHISSALHSMVSLEGKNLLNDTYQMPDDATTEDVLALLDLTDVPTLLVVEGYVVNENTTLKESDTLKIFPVISGG